MVVSSVIAISYWALVMPRTCRKSAPSACTPSKNAPVISTPTRCHANVPLSDPLRVLRALRHAATISARDNQRPELPGGRDAAAARMSPLGQGAQGPAVNQVVSLAQLTGVSEASLPPLLAIHSWLL